LPAAGVGDALDEAGEGVVRDGEEDELGALDDLGDLEHRDPRQKRVDAVAAVLGHRAGADDAVPGGPQRAAEDGTDAARADDAHAESSGSGRRRDVSRHARGHRVIIAPPTGPAPVTSDTAGRLSGRWAGPGPAARRAAEAPAAPRPTAAGRRREAR